MTITGLFFLSLKSHGLALLCLPDWCVELRFYSDSGSVYGSPSVFFCLTLVSC